MSRTTIDAPAGQPFIDVSREFDAPRDLVFRAFSEPELLAQWLGPRKYEMIVDEYDVRAGGSWRYRHRGADGTEHAFHGVFHGDQTPDGMLQTFEYEGAPGHVSLDQLVLEDNGGRTVVRGHSVYQSVAARDAMIESGMEGGMNEGFDRLDELLAGRLART
ncbi:MAG TPA: SRPBCC family protein [Candidatus Limnocylindrales bacterium]|nr:SRPBCC family protein [Candidatus Limnocylindrales bacterium]